MPPVGIPRPPMQLPAPVKSVWDKAAKLLKDMGVLTKVDGLALLILSRAAADYLAYCEAAPIGADVLLTPEGSAYWNLAASARDKAEARLMRMLGEFGLTPSTRSRVRVGSEPAANDPLSAFLDRNHQSGPGGVMSRSRATVSKPKADAPAEKDAPAAVPAQREG